MVNVPTVLEQAFFSTEIVKNHFSFAAAKEKRLLTSPHRRRRCYWRRGMKDTTPTAQAFLCARKNDQRKRP